MGIDTQLCFLLRSEKLRVKRGITYTAYRTVSPAIAEWCRI